MFLMPESWPDTPCWWKTPKPATSLCTSPHVATVNHILVMHCPLWDNCLHLHYAYTVYSTSVMHEQKNESALCFITLKGKTHSIKPQLLWLELALVCLRWRLAAQINDIVRGDGMYFNDSQETQQRQLMETWVSVSWLAPASGSHKYIRHKTTYPHCTTTCWEEILILPGSSEHFHSVKGFIISHKCTHCLSNMQNYLCKWYTFYFNWIYIKKAPIKISFGFGIGRWSPCIVDTIVQTSCTWSIMRYSDCPSHPFQYFLHYLKKKLKRKQTIIHKNRYR